MTRLLFDIETDGLLYKSVDRKGNLNDILTRIHCIGVCPLDAPDEARVFGPTELNEALDVLRDADELIGHNIMQYDLPVLRRFFGFDVHPDKCFDTLIFGQLACPDLSVTDIGRVKAKRLDGKLAGSHSLAAWGQRLGYPKATLADPETGETDWSTYTPEMAEYCKRDLLLNRKVFLKFVKEYADRVPDAALELEHHVAYVISKQEERGFKFDVDYANDLYATLLDERAQVDAQIRESFDDYVTTELFTPKRDNRTKGYKAGVTITRTNTHEFNPNSAMHVAWNLEQKYGWKPTVMTPTGLPKIDESVLSTLEYPEAKLLVRMMELNKLLGYVAEGQANWLRMVDTDGRIHGQVRCRGTVSGRMSHHDPNLGQVPRRGEHGAMCRRCFVGPLIGADASGLELRGLAHFLYPFDGGRYVKIVTDGDPHTANMTAFGLDDRDQSKTTIYATLYGAGNEKIGQIVGGNALRGGQIRRNFERNTVGYATLIKAIQQARKSRNGFLKGLDGRLLYSRSEHSALNLIIQGAGGLIMKKALVLLYWKYLEEFGQECPFVCNVHDEFQIEQTDYADPHEVGKMAVWAIQEAGRAFDFKCPLDAEYKIGENWSETH